MHGIWVKYLFKLVVENTLMNVQLNAVGSGPNNAVGREQLCAMPDMSCLLSLPIACRIAYFYKVTVTSAITIA